MLLRATITIATLAGLASAAVFPRDQGSGAQVLSQSKIDKYSPFSYYAAAATCSTENIATWGCGSACLACDPPFFFPRMRRVGSNAR
jgi:hypothetical protein